jgi:hypothetical protein
VLDGDAYGHGETRLGSSCYNEGRPVIRTLGCTLSLRRTDEMHNYQDPRVTAFRLGIGALTVV